MIRYGSYGLDEWEVNQKGYFPPIQVVQL